MQLAVNYQSAPKSINDENIQQCFDLDLIERAIPELGKCRGIRVILNINGQLQLLFEQRLYRQARPAQVRRDRHLARVPTDQPGNADADARKFCVWVISRNKGGDLSAELIQKLSRVAIRNEALLLQDPPVKIADRKGRVANTDIDGQDISVFSVDI